MVSFVRSAGALSFGLFLSASIALAQTGALPPRPTPSPLLPPSFAGWNAAAPVQTSADPTVADAPNASVLKEYGLKQFASAEYRHGDGVMALKAMQFVDATGAYGAFTFYRKA